MIMERQISMSGFIGGASLQLLSDGHQDLFAPACSCRCDSHSLSDMFLRKPAPPLLAIALQGLLDDGQGCDRWLKIIHLDRFAFESLVILEKAAKQGQAVWGELRGFAKAVVFRIMLRSGEDLVIWLALIEHGQQSN